jgi:hypothetical protein
VDCTKRIGSPSWSWVSAPYSVRIKAPGHSDARLVGTSVQLVSQRSPFGQVKGESITLEALVPRACDLELTLMFEHVWLVLAHNNNIRLDFEDPKPQLENCRLAYLGDGEVEPKGIFLIVEKFGSGRFRRVGYAELEDREKGWKKFYLQLKEIL